MPEAQQTDPTSRKDASFIERIFNSITKFRNGHASHEGGWRPRRVLTQGLILQVGCAAQEVGIHCRELQKQCDDRIPRRRFGPLHVGFPNYPITQLFNTKCAFEISAIPLCCFCPLW